MQLHPAFKYWLRAQEAATIQADRPLLSYDPARALWILEAAVERMVPHGGGRLVTVAVERGFAFDLASVPRVVWPLIAPFELSIWAPLIHDKLYRERGRVRPVFTRKQSDRAFRYLMLEEGIAKAKARTAYLAVRAGGWVPWRRPA